MLDALHWLLHVDQALIALYSNYGSWCYLILFLIVFCETAFVITPFLPGDSLLFAVGAISAAIGELSLLFFVGLLLAAAIFGNQCNYWIGKYIGNRVVASSKARPRWFHLTQRMIQAEQFYDRHGGKALILSRFIPILRSFAPFVAGISRMPAMRFTSLNIIGAILWVPSLLVLGFLFGSAPWVKQNFTMLVYGIVIVSLMPACISVLKAR